MTEINGKKYYRIKEIAQISRVHERTLRRWLSGGNLDHFLFPFKQKKGGPVFYRLEPPDETDVFIDGDTVYLMPEPKEDRK